jgi:murein DD-endopeptidase MepM/ murein hydrolase activator NlpD
MAVFLAVSLLFASLISSSSQAKEGSERGVLGGPQDAPPPVAEDMLYGISAFGIDPIMPGYVVGDIIPSLAGEDALAKASLNDPGQPIGPVFSRENLLAYSVQKGDTLSGIAEYFGLPLDTIVNANPSIRANSLQPGDKLNILPTSGIVYQTKQGDTLESIADYFNLPTDKIVQFNKAINFGMLDAGVSLVIPGAKTTFASSRLNSLPNFKTSFVKPADGFNWGILHHYNAVDIAAGCGTPVAASAEGLVVPDENFGDGHGLWNGGYGEFVLIEHLFGDGVRTRYAHLEKILVNIGDYVKQGQEIGLMGETGDATGCHVHFEVIGAQNPFAKS